MKTHCKRGHDLRLPGALAVYHLRRTRGNKPTMICALCRRTPDPDAHARGLETRRRETMRTMADVDAFLRAAVRHEVAPPWERHPEPWDNLVLRANA